jgi:hypothetical protein
MAASKATDRAIQAGVLSWLVPGAGHCLLGHRGLGIVCFVAVTFAYCVGLAYGGVVPSVNVHTNRWLFVAELGTGGYTLPALVVSRSAEAKVLAAAGLVRVPDQQTERDRYDAYLRAATNLNYMSYYPESDVATIYLATAGLLNVLVILDAISRAQTGGLPTFHRELAGGTPTSPARGS